MFSKVLGKNKSKQSEESEKLIQAREKIANMNLTEMRTYVNNKISTFEVSSVGLLAIMNKLTLTDTSTKKLYISNDDMDSKKKKAFELVLIIAKNKKLDVTVVQTIQNFTQVYAELIAKFDKDHKEIYASRFRDILKQAVIGFASLAEDQSKMKVLGQ
jgi:Ni,Fe-hydrogenase III component G